MEGSSKEGAEDAITEEEMVVTELMSRKSKRTPDPTNPTTKTATRVPAGRDRDGLGAYIQDPASFPSSIVVHHDADWVVIRDMFPKATVHLLLLPRNPQISAQHPFDALANPAFLASAQAEASKWRHFAANELRRQLGASSATESARRAAMEADEPPTDAAKLPPGRDWAQEVHAGVHAHPSMHHVHIHVISRDMHSGRMKHRKHYNSFNTPFLVDVTDFPLAGDDVRRHPGRQGYLEADLMCWRCGKNFGRAFARLKEHLEEEFEQWRGE
ncbi:MAG: aprataxin-like protein [Bathelium mastoideum]|nr:MAG: aprataxin-like protein [Bathelium mastoideum]